MHRTKRSMERWARINQKVNKLILLSFHAIRENASWHLVSLPLTFLFFQIDVLAFTFATMFLDSFFGFLGFFCQIRAFNILVSRLNIVDMRGLSFREVRNK